MSKCSSWYIFIQKQSEVFGTIKLTRKIGNTNKCVAGCPDGWHVLRGNYYKFFEKAKNWRDAKTHCQAEGGHLASVHSNEENEFVAKLSPLSKWLWLGGNDLSNESIWLWSDKSSFSFSSWSPGNPDNSNNQDCLVLNYGGLGKWDDQSCSVSRQFVCKITNFSPGKYD